MPDARSSATLPDQASPTSTAREQVLPAETVLDALKMMLTGASLSEVLTSITRLIEAHSEGMLCSIFLLDEDGAHLRYGVAANVTEAYRTATDGICIGPTVGSCGAAAYLRQPVFVSDMLSHPNWQSFRDVVLQSGLRAAWSAPILSKESTVLGTFCMYYREVRYPSPDDIQMIDHASQIAGIAIERHRAEENLRRAQVKLQQEEEETRRIVDAISQTVVVLNPEGRALYANRVVLEYTGLSMEEVQAETFRARVFHPDDIQRLLEERRKALSGTVPFENEQRILGKDGRYRWFLIRYNPLRDDNGRVVRWYATGTDIEHRKQAENKLRQDERELRQLIDFLPQHVVVLDKEGKLLQANKTLLDYNGYTLEEMQGPGTQERIQRDLHPEDVERAKLERSSGLSSGVPFEIEKRLRGKDGRYRWFLFRYKPVLNEDGHIVRWFATATDIEERKHAEDRMRNETVALREDIARSSMFEEIVGSSEVLRKILAHVSRVAPTDSTVLILGETGTGKELIARAIHQGSKRAGHAFIRVNCAAIPPSLIASELFGHEKGSFTGAIQQRMGRFQAADGGTIFLDEVGDLPAETQIALLRVLQEREIERVGSVKPIRIDVRVLAATNRDLEDAVAAGRFRKDLFYRLNIFPMRIPSLRERADDIPLLAQYFVERYAKQAGKKITHVSKRTFDLFQSYDWPGNIRELQNVIERAVILCDDETFTVEETWFKRDNQQSSSPTVPLAGLEALGDIERAHILRILQETGWVIEGKQGAAVRLGLHANTLRSRMQKLGIKKPRLA